MASRPINLECVSDREFKYFLDSFDYVISDCDGVLWMSDPLPGSGPFINTMKEMGKKCFFVSNNSIHNEGKYRAKFKSCHIDDAFENLITPAIGIADYFKSINFKGKIYSISCERTDEELKKAGFEVIHSPTLEKDFHIGMLAALTNDDPEVKAVVMDSCYHAAIAHLWQASVYLNRSDVLFVIGAPDDSVPIRPGILGVGSVYMSDILKNVSGRDHITLAKPGKIFGQIILRHFGIKDPSRVLFIGDTIKQDVGIAKATGFKSLYVLTTHTLDDATEELMPDYYATTLGTLIGKLQKHSPIVTYNGNGIYY